MDIHQLHIALNALDFWALFVCMGLLIARLWLLPPDSIDPPALDRRWRFSLGFGLAVLTMTGIALFLVRTVEMAGTSLMETLPLLPQVLQQAHFGHVWGIHLVALAALWVGWGVSRRLSYDSGMGLMLAAMLALTFTYSASSHAADRGDFMPPEIIDWLHVLSAAAWGGGILGTTLFIFPALRLQPERRSSLLVDVAGRLSTLSTYALLAVVLTGLLNAALRLGDFGMLIQTAYGRILCVKLLLVAAMAGVGAINRFILVPRVQQSAPAMAKESPSFTQFRAALRIDTVLVLLVLIVAALLIQAMPPAGMAGMAGMAMDSTSSPDHLAMTPPKVLTVDHAWVRQMAPGQETAEAFMDITSPVEATLVAISTPLAEQVEIHSMRLENNIMRMQQMPSIDLPAGRTVRLSPGVIHLMLINPKHTLKAGESVPFRLTVQNADQTRIDKSISVPVRQDAPVASSQSESVH